MSSNGQAVISMQHVDKSLGGRQVLRDMTIDVARGESCVIVEVPASGYLVDAEYGAGWECSRGYRKAGARCVAVQVPQHGHLDYSGNDWECDRPYSKRRDSCEQPVTAPTAQ
jgi:hypothetical protein